LEEHKSAILEYFSEHSIDGRRCKLEQNQIAKELSKALCGRLKLKGIIVNGLMTTMNAINWNDTERYGDIPGIRSLSNCAAMQRIQFILGHFERWTADSVQNNNRYRVSITDFIDGLKEEDDCQYTLSHLQRDLERVLNSNDMESTEQCGEGINKCIHCRRNQRFGDGVEETAESVEWFGTDTIGEVKAILIMDRLHCLIKHDLNTLEREMTFNLFLRDIRSATFPQYAHGIPMKYHSLTPKHKNLITELRCNTMCPLSKKAVDKLVEIAKSIISNNDKVRGWKARRSSPENGIRCGDAMYLEFIICLRIYCSYSVFCKKFRASFRKLKYDDTEDTIRQRHIDSFYWFGRFLECALMFYGKQPTKKKTIYHGLDNRFLFDSFSAVFEVPLSTTDSLVIAKRFASGRSGIILSFAPKFKRSLKNNAYYLGISGSELSDFDEEREYLFAGDAILAITDLTTLGPEMKSYKDYMMCFLYWERILEQSVDTRSKYIYGVITPKTKLKWMELQKRCLVPLIRRRTSEFVESEGMGIQIPSYIMELFNHFCDQKSSINLSCFRMEMEFMEQSLKHILFQQLDDGQFVVNEATIHVIFPNLLGYVNEDEIDNVISSRSPR